MQIEHGTWKRNAKPCNRSGNLVCKNISNSVDVKCVRVCCQSFGPFRSRNFTFIEQIWMPFSMILNCCLGYVNWLLKPKQNAESDMIAEYFTIPGQNVRMLSAPNRNMRYFNHMKLWLGNYVLLTINIRPLICTYMYFILFCLFVSYFIYLYFILETSDLKPPPLSVSFETHILLCFFFFFIQ